MIALVALALAAGQPVPPGQPPAEPNVIVVTGERIADLRAALAACLARNCPPNEDVDASLALAEGEFLNGDYARAEQGIAESIARNRRHLRVHPEPVADLYRSQARVQSHRGRDREARQSTYEILRILRAGIPREDHRHFTARFEIVQMEMRLGGDRARIVRELRELGAEARRAGRDDIVRRARMQELFLAYLIEPYGRPEARLRRLAESTDSSQRFETISARFFLAMEYRERGDTARSDRMLAGIPRGDGDTRTLLYAPPIRFTGANSIPTMPPSFDRGNFANRWIDVAYWINAEGRTEGIDIVRHGADPGWAEPVLAAIRARLYAPSSDRTSSYRLERYTYTSGLGRRTGSRMMVRIGVPRVEYLDLTARDEPGREVPVTLAPSGD